jgi:phage repressor protein C with HTH and peptisase S24 domain
MMISERIKILRGKEAIATFAKAMGIHRNTLPRYESGERTPDGDFLARLCSRSGVEPAWLLLGEGPMYKEDQDQPVASAHNPTDDKDGEYVQVPRYEVAASAGGGAWVESEQIVDYLSFRAGWVRNSLGVPLNNLALINVIGDSMEPTLADGDVVLLDTTSRNIQDSAIYVLQMNGTLLVKRIQHRLDGSLVVKSDNELYEAEIVTGEMIDQLRIVGRVVWSGRKM